MSRSIWERIRRWKKLRRSASSEMLYASLESTVLSIPQDTSLDVLLSARFLNNDETVTPTVTGLPSGVTGVFIPTTISRQSASAVLRLTASPTATPITNDPFIVTVPATGGAPAVVLNATITVETPSVPPVIAISASPTATSAEQGAVTNTTVTLTRTAYTDDVTLSASGLPSGASATFLPNPMTGATTTSLCTVTNTAGASTVTNDAWTIAADGTGVTQATQAMTHTIAAPSVGNPTPSGTVLLDTRSGGNADLQAATTLTGWMTQVKATSGNVNGTNLFCGSARYTDAVQPSDYVALGMTPFVLSTNFDGSGTNALQINTLGYGDMASQGYAKTTLQRAQNLRLLYSPLGKPAEMYVQWKVWYGRTATGGGFDDGVLVNGVDRSSQVGRYAICNEEVTENNAAHKMYLCTRPPGGSCGRDDFIITGQPTTRTAGTGTVTITPTSGNQATAVFSTSQSLSDKLLRIDPEWELYEVISGSGTTWTIATRFDPNGSIPSWSGKSFSIMTKRSDPFQINSNNNGCTGANAGFPASPKFFGFNGDIKSKTNQVNTFTFYHKAGSAINSSDNIYRVWLNGVLIGESLTMDHGNMGFEAFQLPNVVEKPRWTQTAYYYDMVVWRP